VPNLEWVTNLLVGKVIRATTSQKMVKEKILQGQEKVREFRSDIFFCIFSVFRKGKSIFIMEKSGKFEK